MTDQPEYADPERYAELTGFHGEWRDLFWNRDFLELMARRLCVDDVREVLDVGCGAGHWGRTLLSVLPRETTMVGVDREPHFLPMAEQGAAARGLRERVSFVQGSVEALPFEDDRFDLVTCQLVLIHVRDLDVALREMIRVTRPGGLVVLAEPDNRAGNLALLGGSTLLDDDEILELLRLQLSSERGKRALGEGDNSVGGRLPGRLRAAGLQEVRAHTNDRCMSLAPPYDEPEMRIALEQEHAWAAQGINVLLGTRHDTRRLVIAGGGDEAMFERGWAALCKWQEGWQRGVIEGTYHAARGFVMYLVSGRKPAT